MYTFKELSTFHLHPSVRRADYLLNFTVHEQSGIYSLRRFSLLEIVHYVSNSSLHHIYLIMGYL